MLWVTCTTLGRRLLAEMASAAHCDSLQHALSACLANALDLQMQLLAVQMNDQLTGYRRDKASRSSCS